MRRITPRPATYFFGLAFLGGASFSASADFNERESIAFFNQYCNATYSQAWRDKSAFVPDKAKRLSAESDEVQGILGRPYEDTEASPLTDYDEISENGHYAIWCSWYSDKVLDFQFPDLSDIHPLLHIYLPIIDADFLMPGSSVRSLVLGGRDLQDISRLSEITIKADYPDPDYKTHVFISDADWDLVLPEKWNIDITGEIPFTFRLGKSIEFDEGYRGLQDLSEAHVVFRWDKTVNMPPRMPAEAPFCQNYGDSTQVFVDDNDIPNLKDRWIEVPKHFVCDDGQPRKTFEK